MIIRVQILTLESMAIEVLLNTDAVRRFEPSSDGTKTQVINIDLTLGELINQPFQEFAGQYFMGTTPIPVS